MKCAAWSASLLLLVVASTAHAHEFYVGRVPNPVMTVNSIGLQRACINCHNNPDGGDGCLPTGGIAPCLNPFGMQFRTNLLTWNPALATLDADGDGFTNGEELQDPTGMWRPVDPMMPGVPAYHTAPGFATDDSVVCAPLTMGAPFRTGCSSPGLHDADGDGYCYFGIDADHNGSCDGRSATENPINAVGVILTFDCDDSMSPVHTMATEICTNLIDDDCNGLDTLHDPACSGVVDGDGDGWCPTGHDLNGDRNCLGTGEPGAVVDCDDTHITVHPMARENCTDGLDNNCDGMTDLADPMCTGTNDVDGDGYCPIGADLDHNGDCLGVGEMDPALGSDCDDTNAAINPSVTENCTDGVDNDCNGFADRMDPHCGAFLDADGDTYCPMGRDGDADGDCLDSGENDGSIDCNDSDATIHPGAMEDCLGSLDHNCDGTVGLADPLCAGFLDTDHDRYCFVGFDLNIDGDCADAMEQGGHSTDCNDMDATISPAATEVCTDGIDNNCDGSTDAHDPHCAHDYLDADHDGWCVVGHDLNGDGDCADVGEQAGPADADLGDGTVYPGAPENCLDHKDNNQDGTCDYMGCSVCDATGTCTTLPADPTCTRDHDGDGDGYCPLGADLNHDGDCLDSGENVAVSDCDDSMAAIGPGNPEITRPICSDYRDNDCDSNIDLLDADCWLFLDRDGDGFCPMGIDDNGNGTCLDEGEDRFGADCNDDNALIGPRATENCTNGVDDDCDGATDLFDSQCNCLSIISCDDHDPCTIDNCAVPPSSDAGVADGGDAGPPPTCAHTHDVACDDGGRPPTPDAGVADGATGDGGTTPPSGGCCAVAGTGGASRAPALLLLFGCAWILRTRRRRASRRGRNE